MWGQAGGIKDELHRHLSGGLYQHIRSWGRIAIHSCLRLEWRGKDLYRVDYNCTQERGITSTWQLSLPKECLKEGWCLRAIPGTVLAVGGRSPSLCLSFFYLFSFLKFPLSLSFSSLPVSVGTHVYTCVHVSADVCGIQKRSFRQLWFSKLCTSYFSVIMRKYYDQGNLWKLWKVWFGFMIPEG